MKKFFLIYVLLLLNVVCYVAEILLAVSEHHAFKFHALWKENVVLNVDMLE